MMLDRNEMKAVTTTVALLLSEEASKYSTTTNTTTYILINIANVIYNLKQRRNRVVTWTTH